MVHQLLVDGGVEIRTLESESPDSGNSGNGDGNRVLIRTLIQTDADIMTHLCPSVLARPEICQRHLRNIQNHVDTLRRLRRNVGFAVLGSRGAGGLLLGVSAWDGWSGLWREHLFWTAGGIVFGSILVFGKFIALRLFRLYFRRKLGT
jgi:hypothetical protein